MGNHCFSFLEDSYADICNEAMFCEKHLVEGYYADSIIRAGRALEIITENICEFSDLDYLKREGLYNRLIVLFNEGIIDDNLFEKFRHIRLIRNKIAFYPDWSKIGENANIAHKYLYEICVYFYKTYQDSNFIAEEYNGPKMAADS